MIPRRAPRLAGAMLGLLLLASPATAQDSELREIPEATGYVTDAAGVIDEPTRARLEAFLDQVEKKTGVEFAVLTMPSTAPELPEQYKVRVFERWGIGKRGRDDGLLALLAVEERAFFFETGYGLEGTLPDGLQTRIFRQHMLPRFREGDFPGGLIAGVQAAAARIAAEKGVTLEWGGRTLRYTRESGRMSDPGFIALALFVGIVLAIFLISNHGGPRNPGGPRQGRRRGGWNDWGSGSGGWGSGWGGPGGGFGGGLGGGLGGWGGSSSGGGSGGFGGFGGGRSGGGGGGGRW